MNNPTGFRAGRVGTCRRRHPRRRGRRADPYLLVPDVTIEKAAAGRATLTAMMVALIAGGAILLPALVYLYSLFQRAPEVSSGR